MLTTSAYGAEPDDAAEDVVRTADAQRWRARLRGRGPIGALFDSDTYTRPPAPAQQGARPRAAGRRLGAVRALARRCALHARAPLRLRDHDLAAGVGARGRAARCTAAACPGSPTSATPGPSSRCGPRFPTARAAPRSTSGSSAAGSAPPTRSSASPSRPPRTCARRGIAEPLLIPQRLGSRAGAERRPSADRPARPRARLARLHRPLRQLRPRPARRWSRRSARLAREDPEARREARAGRSPGR